MQIVPCPVSDLVVAYGHYPLLRGLGLAASSVTAGSFWGLLGLRVRGFLTFDAAAVALGGS